MPTIRDIKRRIKSVQDISQITRAMKIVAATKLKRSEEQLEHIRQYIVRLETYFGRLIGQIDMEAQPICRANPDGERVALMIISADKGLCGPFNTNTMRQATAFLDKSEKPVDVVTVGRKGYEYLSRRDYNIIDSHRDVFAGLSAQTAVVLGNQLVQLYNTGKYETVYLLYNKFISAIAQDTTIKPLLPFEKHFEIEQIETETEYILEPDPQGLFDSLLPRYLKMELYSYLLESQTSEYGARLAAMDQATNNALEMIDYLTLTMNRARQAAITTEISEIVGGKEALSK